MPTAQQIAQRRAIEMAKKPKTKTSKKILKIALGVVLIFLGYMYYTSPKIIKIPNQAYALKDTSHFKELFDSSDRKLIWFGANCPWSNQKKEIINMLMKKTQMDKYYVHYPFLQSSFSVGPTDLLGQFIMKNCSSQFCIVDPLLGKIARTDDKHLLIDMTKFVVDENWNASIFSRF